MKYPSTFCGDSEQIIMVVFGMVLRMGKGPFEWGLIVERDCFGITLVQKWNWNL